MKRKLYQGLFAGLMLGLSAITSYAVPNPAAAYAEKLGYVYTANAAGGTVTLPDGVVLDAWDFFRGKAGSQYAYGAQYGYDTVNRRIQTNGYFQSFAVCVPKDPSRKGTAEEISLLDLMKKNGEPLWENTRGAPPPAVEAIMKTAPLTTFPKQALPSTWDWRNVGGVSYIGAIRDQGSCGSCYSFGAAAAAEGAFNYSLGRTGSSCADFSEAYIAWCLGKYGAYSSHFSGCDGADYEYQELQALTVEGICNESQMPYNSGSDPGSCTWSGTTTVFQSWARVPSGDINAIKTAIMTYGVVDAAVLTDTAFMNYDTGVYDNNNNDCNSGYNETSDHAISLVGWDDNPPEGGGGVFILRNSWGASGSGEGGYMRIRTNAAVVHCAVCYMVYGPPPATAPTFTSGTNYTATTGVARAFTVTASGNPTPALALLSSTATAGNYAFSNATGVLTYTPPTNDVGTKTFTFKATNTAGAATQTVNVVVSLAPPAAPASIWASATNTTDYTAAWSSVSGAAGYRLDVATNSTFGGGSADELFISEYIEADSGSEKYIEIFNGTGSSVNMTNYSLLMFINGATSPTTIALTGTAANNDVFVVANSSATNSTVIDLTSGSLTFNGNDAIALSNKTTHAYVDIIGQIGTDPGTGWGTDPTTTVNSTIVRKSSIVAGDTNGSDAFDPATEWDGFAGVNIETYLGAHTFSGGGTPSYVAGYSNRTVAGTSQSVTGLTAGATYYFRVRATNAAGPGANSSVANVTTLMTLSAPAFGANPGPVATTSGVAVAFMVSATGVPAPTLALQSTTASTGYGFTAGTGQLTYTPPQADGSATRTFTITASNSQGVVSQTVSVVVTAGTAPSFTGGAGPYATTAGVAVAFTVSATGTPAATLALQSTTASSGHSFTPGTGALNYTPPAGDVGARTFTFTASNVAGVATQVTSVSVAEAPSAPTAPASIWASATNATSFTAAWSAVANATDYRLDVGTNETFSGGGGAGGQSVLATNSATVTAITNNGWTALDLSGTTYAQMLKPTSVVTSPAFSTIGFTNLTVDMKARTYNGTAAGTTNITVSISTNNGTDWIVVGVVAPTNNSMQPQPTLTNTANLGHSQTRIRWQTLGASGTIGVGITNLFVQGWSGASSTPAYVPGYSNRMVAGTSQSVTGLVEGATYYFRARAVNGVGTSPDSATASVTTAAAALGNQTITFPAIGAQVTTNVVALSATASSGLAVTFAVGSGPATISGGATLTFTNAGAVSIVASQAGNGSWNPAPNVTNSFTVSKATASVTLNGLAQVYDGTARTVTATTVPGSLSVGVTYNGSGTVPTAAGSYAVTGTVSDAMYQGTKTGTLAVAKATVGVTLSGLSQIYDGSPKSATATTAPAGLAVGMTYNGSGSAPSAVGSYTVVATVAEANYVGGATGTLDIAAVTDLFESWLENEEGQAPSDPDYAPDADVDQDGANTWDEFLADTDPSLSNSVLVLTGRYTIATAEGGTGSIRLQFPASTSRYYQLEYCTDITNHATVGTTNLGWGVPGMAITNNSPGTWYGVIRVFLQAP